MSLLQQLFEKTKCNLIIEYNPHKGYYNTLLEHIEDHDGFYEPAPDILDKMVELDTLISIQIYPNTPVGFFVVCHYDFDLAVQQCLDILNQ